MFLSSVEMIIKISIGSLLEEDNKVGLMVEWR